jgi:hypothetical protein
MVAVPCESGMSQLIAVELVRAAITMPFWV